MKNRLRSYKDVAIVGMALFSMFFGAGNLLFPPKLGTECGSEWGIGFIFYFVIDVGLGVLAVFSMVQHGGDTDRILAPVGRKASKFLMIMIILCIGPGIAIPRTAATTYEMGILPIMQKEPGTASLAVFSVLFFAVVLFLSIRPSKVVDILGKFLTPVLLASLVLLIIWGVAAPLGELSAPLTDSPVESGVLNGYQTLDLLAGILFSMILISSVRDRGYESITEGKPIVMFSALLAGLLLFVVYAGLTYLGASSGGQWAADAHRDVLSNAVLLVNITEGLLGAFGRILLAIVVTFACLTTAISLSAASADFFTKVFDNKVSYRTLIILVCVVSCAICNLGLMRIIGIAAPILMVLYPVVIVLIVGSFLRFFYKDMLPHTFAAAVALLMGMLSITKDLLPGSSLAAFDASLPLARFGFEWLIPAVIAFVIGIAVSKIRQSGKAA